MRHQLNAFLLRIFSELNFGRKHEFSSGRFGVATENTVGIKGVLFVMLRNNFSSDYFNFSDYSFDTVRQNDSKDTFELYDQFLDEIEMLEHSLCCPGCNANGADNIKHIEIDSYKFGCLKCGAQFYAKEGSWLESNPLS